MKSILIISTEGVISSSIDVEIDGKPKAIKNSLHNWRIMAALSRDGVAVTWQYRDIAGEVLDEKPFEKSPPYQHRREQLEPKGS